MDQTKIKIKNQTTKRWHW